MSVLSKNLRKLQKSIAASSFIVNRALDERRGSQIIRSRFPDLTTSILEENRKALEPLHALYVREISTADMAISLESAAFLLAFAHCVSPKRIVDLGSGFSSYVLRLYASQASSDTRTYSVDDDSAWLKRTEEFLISEKVSTDDLCDWSDFADQKEPKFDLILHDMGSMETRANTLDIVIGLLAPGGAIILDDMHKIDYNAHARRRVREAGLELFSLRKLTADGFQRFAELAIRKDSGSAAD